MIRPKSTFPNPFAIVFPLICVFWIQLTRTNAVFSRIALVSRFCAEIQLSGKIPENMTKLLFYQKTHRARIRDGEGPWGAHTTWWRGPGQAAPGGAVAAPSIASTPHSAYICPLTWKHRGFSVFPRKSSDAPPPLETTIRNQKLCSGTLPGWGFRGDHRHHHHRRLSINHPWFPHPCVSNSHCRRRGC
jgi:hypothetical protein